MIRFYHPSKTNKGFASSFSDSFNGDCVFLTLLKQSGWDEKNDNGLFKDSINDPEKNVKVKISDTEIAGILDCIERNRPFSTYHDSEKEGKTINFSPWVTKNGEDNVQKGFSFTINITKKDDSNYKNAFYIGFTFAESRLIREFLIDCLHNHFVSYAQKDRESFKANLNKKEQPKQEGPTGEIF